MVHIFTDSASMTEKDFAGKHGISVFPLHIEMDGTMYRDEEQITSSQVIDVLLDGKHLRTSQPSMGEKLDAYNEALQNKEDEVIDLCMADGLSGTWQSAECARAQCLDPDRVHVFNTETLAGPQKKMVEEAVRLKEEGKSAKEILAALETMKSHENSMLAVNDVIYLGRSGRLSETAAKAGSFLRLVPTVQKSADGTTLNLLRTNRTMKKACTGMIDTLLEQGADENWSFFICHARNEQTANAAKEQLLRLVPGADVSVLPLCSLFCVHGGPGCIAIQAVKPVR